MRADRLLRLLTLLQRHRRAKAAWLADQLEISERTVLRDMEALSTAGVPVYTEQGRGGGCVLLDGFTTDATGLTPDEAQALFAWAGRESTQELGLHHDLAGALAKVAATVPARALERAESLGEVVVSDRRRWFAAADDLPHLPALRAAVLDRRRVRVRYAGAGDPQPRVRTLDPHGLVDHSGRWYLLAEHRGEVRTYRVSRVSSVTILPDAARLRDDRPLAEVWRERRASFESGSSDNVTLELAVSSTATAKVRSVLAMSMVPGSVVEELGVEGDRELWRVQLRARRPAIGQVAALVGDVRVLGPPDFVADLLAAAQRLIADHAALAE